MSNPQRGSMVRELLFTTGELWTASDAQRWQHGSEVMALALLGATVFYDDFNDTFRTGFKGTDCQASSTGGLNYSVATGVGFYYDSTITDDFTTKYRPIVIPTAATGALAANDPTNPRIDVLCLAPATTDDTSETVNVKDPSTGVLSTSTISRRRKYYFALSVVTGTPAATPAAPATPAGYVKIAEADIPATAGAATFRDTRPILQLCDNLANPGLRDYHGNWVPGSTTELQVTQSAVASMVLNVAGGVAHINEQALRYIKATVTISAADATNPRYDLVCAKSDGTFAVTAGTAAATPAVPATPSGRALLAVVLVGATVTTILTANITDGRVRRAIPNASISVPRVAMSAAAESSNAIAVTCGLEDQNGTRLFRAARVFFEVLSGGLNIVTDGSYRLALTGRGTVVVSAHTPTFAYAASFLVDLDTLGTCTVTVTDNTTGANRGCFLRATLVTEAGAVSIVDCPFN